MSDYGEPISLIDNPEKCRDLYIGDATGKCVAIVQHFNAAQIDRAIACYNACVGIPDPERVIPLLVALVEAAKTYEQRKALILFTGGNLEAVHDAYLSALGNAITAKGD